MTTLPAPRRPYARLDPNSYKRTLAQRLAGVRLVDPMRNLLTVFGLRHYEVHILRIQWSGGKRGQGAPFVAKSHLVEPTPRIRGIEGIAQSIEGPGVQEVGSIVIDRISAEYSEELLRGLLGTEEEFPDDCEACWEVTYAGKSRTYRRRFNLTSVPLRKTLGWECHLTRALGDRDEEIANMPADERGEDGSL